MANMTPEIAFQDVSLDFAKEAFENQPTGFNAGRYLHVLMEYEGDGQIGDDTFQNGLTEIRDFLLNP
jgi:hypothetical protein